LYLPHREDEPCALLNIAGFYDRLVAFLDHVVEEQFLKQAHRDILIVNAEALLQAIRQAEMPTVPKWFSMDAV